ncbi:MAG: MFS transporter [Holosporaceae bacterium]|jgi:MFS family permease|nr:MFS transporter [Holosporaceae bacterium]
MANNKKNNDASPMLIWSILSLFFFYQFIARSSFPTVLMDQFMRYFHLDATGIGALTSCYYFIYTFMQIPVGIIVDKFGVRTVASLASAFCAVGVFIFIGTSNYYIAGIGQMLIGFGAAFAFVQTLKSIVTWFPVKKVAMMSSFTISIGCLGPVIGGPAVSQIVEKFEWKSLLEVFSLVGLCISVLIWLIVRDKKMPVKVKHSGEISLLDSLKVVITSRQAWILGFFTMMLYAPLSALGDLWGVSFIKKAYNVDSGIAAFANNMLYVGVVIGSPAFAYLATILDSYKKPMIGATAASVILMAMAIFCTGMPVEAIFSLFLAIGICCGAMLTYPLAMRIFPESVSGTASSFINAMSMVSGIILMPLVGYMMNLSWDGTMENGVKFYSLGDYQRGVTAVLIFLVIGVALSLLIEDRSPKGTAAK